MNRPHDFVASALQGRVKMVPALDLITVPEWANTGHWMVVQDGVTVVRIGYDFQPDSARLTDTLAEESIRVVYETDRDAFETLRRFVVSRVDALAGKPAPSRTGWIDHALLQDQRMHLLDVLQNVELTDAQNDALDGILGLLNSLADGEVG